MLYILHGWSIDPQSIDKWQPLIKLLRDQGHQVKLLKTPGLSAPLDQVWDLDDYVSWLETQLPKTGKVDLLGHSFGGQIAARYTAQHQDKVNKLVLLDSAGIRDKSITAVVKRRGFWLAAKVGKVFFNFELARKLLYKLARERDYDQAPPLLKRTMSTILDDEVVEDLPKIKAQTLLVWGQEDQVTPLKMAHQKKRLIPGSQLQIINGARHSPQFTHPDKVAELVGEFLNLK